MVLLTIVVALLFLSISCYYFKRRYFTLIDPLPGIKPQFLFGNLLQTGALKKDVAFPLIFLELKTKFGDVFQYWLGPSRIVVVNRLEDIEHIFANRHIYDQADLFTEKIGIVNRYAILSLKGWRTSSFSSSLIN